jgi:hypothetical protein
MSALFTLASFAMIRRGARGFWRSLRDVLVFTHRRFAVIQGAPRVNMGAGEQHGRAILRLPNKMEWRGGVAGPADHCGRVSSRLVNTS